MNRSSLLVPDQVTKPQEVNGTNEKAAVAVVAAAAAPPVAEPVKGIEHSSDSEQEEGGSEEPPGSSTIRRAHLTHLSHTLHTQPYPTSRPPAGPAQRDRAVLHCQFCGKRGHAHNFMRSKRFCSTSCARG